MFGKLFDYEAMNAMAEENAEKYRTAAPFPHIVVDNFADISLAKEAAWSFPSANSIKWWSYNNALEKKLATDRLETIPKIFSRILWEMNSGPFVSFLEKLTGIDGLIPDPHYVGGGLHQIEKGGLLKLHCDFNFHKKLRLDRRLNVLLYLNEDWIEEYGGHLELWDEDMKTCEKILPVLNRMVCFSTTDKSIHGHPHPTTCPDGMTRKSLALYYYTNGRPVEEKSEPHSTLYRLEPGMKSTPELEELIKQRGKGRIPD